MTAAEQDEFDKLRRALENIASRPCDASHNEGLECSNQERAKVALGRRAEPVHDEPWVQRDDETHEQWKERLK